MTRTVRELRICIASPSDCNAEREVVRNLVEDDYAISTLCRHQYVSLRAFGWEDVSSDAGRPQSLINAAVEEFDPDWFVFLFWHRFGSDAGLGMTGTEEEWNRALTANEQGNGRPALSIYFNTADVPIDDVDGGQFSALQDFRSTVFAERQALAKNFSGPENFAQLFRAHLMNRILRLETGSEEPGFASEALYREFADASRGLLSWPRVLANGEHIERPEQFRLARKTTNPYDRHNLPVLGTPTLCSC